jgi:aryl-phospho-beta-D-glucosidase BglC (GH1 family)
MNKFSYSVILLIIAFMFSLNAQETDHWFKDKPWSWPKPNPKAKVLPLIKVSGNSFVNPKSDTVLFRGLAISDPDKVEYEGHWNKAHFEQVKEMGANLVRIPVHPIAWRERTPEKYLALLDQAVEWCTDLGMYVVIDWHSIGNLEMELFQAPMYNTTHQETYAFWRTIAFHYRDNNTVAFYEFFNEPTTFRGGLGNATWGEWKKINETLIKLVRSYDKETIPLVAGFDWAFDLTPLREEPIEAEGVAYVTHPYSIKRSEPWEPKWEENFGFVTEKYPVVATEFGFNVKENEKIGASHYAPRIIDYLEGKGISWICWVYDPEWHPAMLKSWNPYELTESGAFFKKALHGELDVQKKK